MKKKIKIANKNIKEYGDVFIIAEVGVNHNKDLDTVINMIDVASDAGADAIKFQTFKAEQVVTDSGSMASYQIQNIGKSMSQLEMLKNLELPEVFYPKIIDYCKRKKIEFLSTPHGGIESVTFLEQFEMPAYKVGSGDLTNYFLLKKLALLNKPIILSTGMCTLEEIKNACQFITKNGNDQIILLHCTTDYPCDFESVNLYAMRTLMKEFKSFPVGYSDHTKGTQVAIMAATLGACVYECHFTLDNNFIGPDHIASANPQELKEKINNIRNVKKILGNKIKEPTPNENNISYTVRRSIVAIKDLQKGTILTEQDIEAKRPANGLSPSRFEELIGKKLRREIRKNEIILFTDLL